VRLRSGIAARGARRAFELSGTPTWSSCRVDQCSGIETDIPTGAIVEFRDGKILRWEDFGSKEKAREAPGVPE
jgi:hypothetical protein